MMSKKQPGKKTAPQNSVHEGNYGKQPKFPSAGAKGASINDRVMRKGTAPTPKSLGGRSIG